MSRVLRRLSALPAVFALAVVLAPRAIATTAFEPLNGDGSSWAGPAIDQFGKDVRPQGIVVNFNPDGSAAGRASYTQNQADFAATDIQYLTQGDPFGGGPESEGNVAYSYIPIVAGGTVFMYNLTVGGRKITDMRLSGDTITKIFTGQITNWDDARIARDYGRRLPSQKITAITRSDGSGATYQFTRWMAKQYASQWDAFCRAHDGPSSNCGPTEFYPGFPGSQQRGGSDQVANYVSASYGGGSIGYDEYAYALQSNIPVVKLLNPAGYYTLPTASNVAIALQSAVIDENPASLTFLIQNLDHVYTNRDPRSYPLSSYSYLIVPRTSRQINGQTALPPPAFTKGKGITLSTWLNYVLCGAQQKAGSLGYSPLPKNLVVGGFRQNNFIPDHVPGPDLTKLDNCNNPTYHNGINFLVRDAPFPSPCDKLGAALGCTTTSGNTAGGVGTGGSGAGSSSRSTTTRGGTAGGVNGASQGSPGQPSGAAAAVKIDPDTGKPVTQIQPGSANAIFAEPVAVTGGSGDSGVLATLTAIELVAAVLVPGLLGAWLTRRREPT